MKIRDLARTFSPDADVSEIVVNGTRAKFGNTQKQRPSASAYDPRDMPNINPTYPSQFDDQPSGSQWRDH